MFVVTGYLTINPDLRAEAEAAIAAFVPATRAEAGCIDYRMSTDVLDPTIINGVEIWEDQAAIDAHMGSAHMAEFMGAIGSCLGGEATFTSHEVSSSTKII
ncbi:putative quinol monooxygenase [Aquihabitans sp. McL0605]|uniref:putative quinol monooxygenase n=1 Tax=Aquihabitans sp. McL0605 TaxID=3415671 RepID=UPI003CFB8C5C